MISPQGYKLGEDPKSKNPFWGEGEDSSVNRIYATATVDDGTGVPSVSTSKTVNGNDITFGFDFHNLKGKDGVGKKGDPGFSPSARVEQTDTGATITITDKSGTTSATVENGTNGDPGFSPSARVEQTDTGATITITDKSGITTATVENGTNGITPNVSATATVNNTTGTPSVQVTKSGTDEAPSFNFDFSGIKGADGQSIAGPGVPAGGTAGQVLAKKSGTDYDTEWVNQSGGSAGYITFGGKDGNFYIPRLEENLYKTFEDFRKNINESSSVTYFLNDAPVDDTINVSGVLNIPAGTPIEKELLYFIGGYNRITEEHNPIPYKPNKSDFTITLTSENTLEANSIEIINIKSNQTNPQDASIEIRGTVGTEAAILSASIGLGQLFIMDQPDMKTYYLEPKK